MSCDSFRFQENHSYFFLLFLSLSLVSYRVINPLSQVPRVHSVQDLSVRKFAPWMFVEAKILVDRHLRFHCFRPLSSALHFLFFFKSCRKYLRFCWGWQEKWEEKYFFVSLAVEKVQSRPVSFWWCHNENAAHDTAATVRINKGSHVTPVDFCTWLLWSSLNKNWGTTILDTPHKSTQ